MKKLLLVNLTVLLGFICSSCAAEITEKKEVDHSTPEFIEVEVKSKPSNKTWKLRKTRIIENLPGFKPGQKIINTCKYGGRTDMKTKATGFFYPKKIDDRWWLVDPDGHPFVHVAIVGVYRGLTEFDKKMTMEQFGSIEKWAEFSTKLLSDYKFNGTGGWSEAKYLRQTSHPLAYTLSWNFMADFAKEKGIRSQETGHYGYPNKCMPVFHPEFEVFADSYAKDTIETKDDPWLVGHFSDNELPAPKDLLDRSLRLDVNDPDMKYNYKAAKEWLTARKEKDIDIKDITDSDRMAFLGYVFDKYYQITTNALRKYDPNHLCLGSRIHGNAKKYPSIFKAAGKHLDVTSINYYHAWSPDQELISRWYEETGKPVMITEWYAKGMDSGLPNNSGAGWTVKTQKERGYFYQNFAFGLMESKVCVGWHWFKFRDNNPADLTAEPSNRDSNKGIVDGRFKPYYPVLEEMKKLNESLYPLIDHFDSK